MASTSWGCFHWRGRPIDLKESDRRDLAVAVPPLQTKYWPKKPASLRAGAFRSIEDAVDWLESEVRQNSAKFHRNVDVLEDLEDRLAWARKDLAAEKAVVWTFWLADRSTQMEWVVLGDDASVLRRD